MWLQGCDAAIALQRWMRALSQMQMHDLYAWFVAGFAAAVAETACALVSLQTLVIAARTQDASTHLGAIQVSCALSFNQVRAQFHLSQREALALPQLLL